MEYYIKVEVLIVKRVKRLIMSIFIIGILFGFCGCSYRISNVDIGDTMSHYYPNTEMVKRTSDSVWILGYGDTPCRKYDFVNDKFQFSVYDCQLIRDAKFPLRGYYSNYYTFVFDREKDELLDVVEKYDILLVDDIDKTQTDKIQCKFLLPDVENDNANILVVFSMKSDDEIETCVAFLSDVYEIIEDYVPENPNDVYNEGLIVNFCLNTEEDFDIETQRFSLYKDHLVKSNIDFQMMLQNAKQEYAVYENEQLR